MTIISSSNFEIVCIHLHSKTAYNLPLNNLNKVVCNLLFNSNNQIYNLLFNSNNSNSLNNLNNLNNLSIKTVLNPI